MGPRRAVAWACVAAGLVVAAGFATRLPAPLFDDPVSSVLEARDGSLLGARIASDGQWRFPGRDSVPGKFQAAVLAAEDKRFRRHPGVDPLALARAAWANLRAGKVVSGGSTITMQVIRMSRGSRPRTYREKFVEAALALRLELGTDKDEVLGLYAAHAPFGGNVVGLEAAAWRYFGRGPADLSWAEVAMLAILPNNPGAVHPGRSRAELLEKRDRLLRRLQGAGTIDDEELELALLEPLPDAPHPLPQIAPHLLQTLAAGDGGAGRRYASTLDVALQRLVGDVASRQSRSLASMGIRHLAALVVDNRTFEVVAYVGNSRWAVGEGTGHAIDLIRRPRSTGSILKPLLFARMLDAGEILPETLVPDIPSRFAGYRPENYDREFRGAVPARTALARSLNVPAVWMLRRHGVDRFYDFLRGMGMTTLHRPPGDYGLTLVLGGAEGTLWDITAMYANVARIGGGAGSPAPGHAAGGFARGQGAGGLAPGLYRPRILADAPHASAGRAPLSVGAAWLTLEALVDVARPGAESQWRVFGGGAKGGVEDGNQLRSPGRLGHRGYGTVHGGGVGGECERGGAAGIDRDRSRRAGALRHREPPGGGSVVPQAGSAPEGREGVPVRWVSRRGGLRNQRGPGPEGQPLRAPESAPPDGASGSVQWAARSRQVRVRAGDVTRDLVRTAPRAGVVLPAVECRISSHAGLSGGLCRDLGRGGGAQSGRFPVPG